jgi:hypothetical protein
VVNSYPGIRPFRNETKLLLAARSNKSFILKPFTTLVPLGITLAEFSPYESSQSGGSAMKCYSEKRASHRCEYQFPVTCAFLNADRFYRGKTMNHSDDGIYFESNFAVKPGASVYIRVENYSNESLRTETCRCGGIRSIGIAEVKWCKEITGTGDHHYGIGLKYYPPPV